MKRHWFLNILLILSLFITALVPLCAFAADEGTETETSSAALLFREDFEGDSGFSKTVTTETVNGNTVWVQKGKFDVTYTPDDLEMTAEQKALFLNASTLTISFSLWDFCTGGAYSTSVIGNGDQEAALFNLSASKGTNNIKIPCNWILSSVSTDSEPVCRRFTWVIRLTGDNTANYDLYIDGCNIGSDMEFIIKSKTYFTDALLTAFAFSSGSGSNKVYLDDFTIHAGDAVAADANYFSYTFHDYIAPEERLIKGLEFDGTGIDGATAKNITSLTSQDGNVYYSAVNNQIFRITNETSGYRGKFPMFVYDRKSGEQVLAGDRLYYEADVAVTDTDTAGYFDLMTTSVTPKKPFAFVTTRLWTVADGKIVVGKTGMELATLGVPVTDDAGGVVSVPFTKIGVSVNMVELKVDYYVNGVYKTTLSLDHITAPQIKRLDITSTHATSALLLDNIDTYAGNPGITSASVTLGSDIRLNYYVNLPESMANTHHLRFTANGASTVKDLIPTGNPNEYVASLGMAPQCMGDTVKAEVTDKDANVLFTKESYSVREYCESLLTGANDKLATLIADLLTYGAEAQNTPATKPTPS